MENNKQLENTNKKTSYNVLLVEDNRICRTLLEKYLFGLDYRVETVEKAGCAVQLINSKPYGLILTDLGLPDQSGTAIIQAARYSGFNRLTPLIVCTAHADQILQEECLGLGANHVLIKPVLLERLKQVIDGLLSVL